MSDETTEPRVVAVDLEIDEWNVAEACAFRAAVGVNAEYALGQLQHAVRAAAAEAREEFGDGVDTPGWKPPADWVPLSMLNIDPGYLLGFAWIAARRSDSSLTFDAMAKETPAGELSEAFYAACAESFEEAAPLPNRAARRARPRSPQTKHATKSGASTAAASRKSTP